MSGRPESSGSLFEGTQGGRGEVLLWARLSPDSTSPKTRTASRVHSSAGHPDPSPLHRCEDRHQTDGRLRQCGVHRSPEPLPHHAESTGQTPSSPPACSLSHRSVCVQKDASRIPPPNSPVPPEGVGLCSPREADLPFHSCPADHLQIRRP